MIHDFISEEHSNACENKAREQDYWDERYENDSFQREING